MTDTRLDLGEGDFLKLRRLPAQLLERPFEPLWALHPDHFHEVMMFGRKTPTPRWQQAYGRPYRYSGTVHPALPVPPLVRPFLDWARAEVDARYDALLLNWYDAAEGHYMGPHRDDVRDLVPGSSVLTVSLGATRTLRMRRWKGKRRTDLSLEHGTAVVIPWATNLRWTHEVLRGPRDGGRRVSVTLRCFRP